MEYQKKKVRIIGVAPLVPHNGHLSDPLNEYSRALKEVSKKKTKTDADHAAMSKIEFIGGLYVNEDGAPIIPGVNLEALIKEGAKIAKQGKEVTAGVLVEDDPVIIYQGPKTAAELFEDKKYVLRASVKVGTARVMRTRPQFPVWALEFEVAYLPDVIDWKSVQEALVNAGRLKGLGDWRPRFGRFEVQTA